MAMTLAEAFAAIPLAAVCCDQNFGRDEARVIRQQLLSRTPYRDMPPYDFGMLVAELLTRFREDSWQGLIQNAAPQLNPEQRETAFALASQLIHCDRCVTDEERTFLRSLAQEIQLDTSRAEQIIAVCDLIHRDCLAGT